MNKVTYCGYELRTIRSTLGGYVCIVTQNGKRLHKSYAPTAREAIALAKQLIDSSNNPQPVTGKRLATLAEATLSMLDRNTRRTSYKAFQAYELATEYYSENPLECYACRSQGSGSCEALGITAPCCNVVQQ